MLTERSSPVLLLVLAAVALGSPETAADPPASPDAAASPALEAQANRVSGAPAPPRRSKGRSPNTCRAILNGVLAQADVPAKLPLPARQVLVVGIPDPVESGLGDLADTTISGVVAGMTDAGFLRDRFWLPWDLSGDEREVYGDCPGLILFRSQQEAAASDFRVVLLVGESPLWGAAPERIQSIADLVVANTTGTVSVVGPYFTRTAESYHAASPKSHDPRRSALAGYRLCFTSGSSVWRERIRSLNVAFGCPMDESRMPPTLLPDNTARVKAVSSFFGGGNRKITFVTEEGTSLGGTIKAIVQPSTDRRHEVEWPFATDFVRFPPKLSRPHWHSADATTGGVDSYRFGASERAPADQIPSQATKEEVSNRQELAIHQMIWDMRTGEAILQGSVLEDLVTLSQRLRARAPNTRFWFWLTDRTLTHPDFNSFLRGSLVLSVSRMNGSQDLFEDRRFSRDSERGVYAATRLAMDSGEAWGSHNAVTLSVLSNGRLWPIVTYDGNGKALDPFAQSPGEDPPRFPWTQPMAASALLMLTMALILVPWVRDWAPRREHPAIKAGVRVADSIALSCWLAALFPWLPIVAVGLRDSHAALGVATALGLGMTGVGAGLLIAQLSRLIREVREWPVDGDGKMPAHLRWSPLIEAAVATATILGIGVAASVSIWQSHSVALVRRSMVLSGGASPIAPLMLCLAFLGGSAMATSYRKRRSGIVAGVTWTKELGFAFPAAADHEKEVADLVRRPPGGRRWGWLWSGFGLCLVVIVLLLLRPTVYAFHDFTLEDRWLEGALAVALSFTFLTTVTSAIRLLRFAAAFRKLLRALAPLWPRNKRDNADVSAVPVRLRGRTVADHLAGADGDNDDLVGQLPMETRPVAIAAVVLPMWVRMHRTWATTSIVGALVLVLASYSYVFSVSRLLVLIFSLLTVAIVVNALYAVTLLERDDVLSWLGGTTPGRLTFQGYGMRLVEWGVIPLLVAFSAYNPAVVYDLVKWLKGGG